MFQLRGVLFHNMSNQDSPIGSGPTPPLGNTGGTVRPVYGERRPVMFHLFDTEMDSISAFNGQALVWSSLGSLLLNIVAAILIGYAFVSGPMSEMGLLMVYKVAPFVGVLSLICFAGAIYVICRKKTLIAKIRRETRTEAQPPPR